MTVFFERPPHVPHDQHCFGEVLPQFRLDIPWPPRCLLFWNCMTGEGIWFTYKCDRFFPMRYIFATNPSGADCEGGDQNFTFDVRNLPRQFTSRLNIDQRSPHAQTEEERLKDFYTESRHIRRAIQRALLGEHDFTSHEKTPQEIGYRMEKLP